MVVVGGQGLSVACVLENVLACVWLYISAHENGVAILHAYSSYTQAHVQI